MALAILDVDGTLIDTSYLHALAWARAFREVGRDVPTARLHRGIGRGTDELIDWIVDADDVDGVDESQRRRLGDAHTRHYADLRDDQRLLPGARELLAALDRIGLAVALATSMHSDELERVLKLLDAPIDFAAVVNSEDVESAKPDPDLVGVALREAGSPPEQALFLGDAVWDVVAAAHAGVPAVGVLTGGISEAELRDAGAVEVYESPAHLAAELHGSAFGRLAAR